MNTEAPQEPSAAFNPWPVSIIAFFTVAIIGCGALVAFCSRHPADLVAADYYEQEIRYQAQIDSLQHAKQRAEAAKVTYDARTRLISVTLPQALPQSRLVGKVQLYRPSAVNLDREFALEPKSDGVQTIDARALAPGLWKVRVSWTADHLDYFVDQKVTIGPPSS